MYKVIKAFKDLTDVLETKDGSEYYGYQIGDTYPRQGYTPSAERIAELASDKNKMHTPLIKNIGGPKKAPKEEAPEKDVDIKELTVKQLRELAEAKGLKVGSRAKKDEIIKMIEEN